MALLTEQFDTFISNINPDEQSIAYAIEAHSRVRECLEKEDDFKEFVEGSFLYGSYKRHTAVGNIKDVDVVILTNFDTKSEDNTPAKVLRRLKAALARCYDDPEKVEYQRRSIRVNDPLPDNPDASLTLDIIPAVIQTTVDEPLLIPDKSQKEWILSHPKGHLKHANNLNSAEYSKCRFVPLVKMMKWWWKYQCELVQPDIERPKPKGFWIEALTGETFDKEQTAWANHFISVLENIKSKYSDNEEAPELVDTGLPQQKIKTNISKTEFKRFMQCVSDSLDKAILARDEPDKLISSEMWREILGDIFPLYDEDETEEERSEAKAILPGDISHTQPLPYPYHSDKRYKVSLDAYIYKEFNGNKKKLGGLNSGQRILSNGLSLKFIAKTRAESDCIVLWQVVNTGKHAQQMNGLRGGFFESKLSSGDKSPNQLIIRLNVSSSKMACVLAIAEDLL
jgi:hypothetical protein